VSDSALPLGSSGASLLPRTTASSSARQRNQAVGAKALTWFSGLSAVIPLFVLGAMLVILFVEALPSIRYSGWSFFTSSAWATGNQYGAVSHAGGVTHLIGEHYGAWPLILGTIESSAIALVVGFPIAVGAAVLLVEKLPQRIAAFIGVFLEVLAGIPSAVIGLWGLFTFGPWLAKHIYPILVHLPNFPPFSIFHGQYSSSGEGLLTGGLVLAAMIIPLIAATTRDLLRQVPDTTKEGAEAVGMTHFEVFRAVDARWVRAGVVGAAVLGLGRALGETIAIALVAGGVQQVPNNIYASASTIAATIVLQLGSALADPSGLEVRALAEAAFVLLAITFIVNVIARQIVKRAARGASLPIGAGF
jgi:phosphate transport system permease protein